MSSNEASSTNKLLHGLFLYTAIFIILVDAEIFKEAFGFQIVALSRFFPHLTQIIGPTLLIILIANLHAKYQSIQLTANTRDIILAFAIGAIIFLETFHAYFSGYPLELEFGYDLLLILLCYSTIKSFEFGKDYIDIVLESLTKTTFVIAVVCVLIILYDFSNDKTGFFKGNCLELNIFNYFLTSCKPFPNYINKISQLTPFIMVLAFWCIFRNTGNKLFHSMLIVLLILIVAFSKARLPWMLSFLIIGLAGLFTIYRSRGLKMASAAVLLCLMLMASLTFLFSETIERLLTLNRGITPELEAEIRNWDNAVMERFGLLLRYELILEGLRQFAESPIIGRGLGGVLGDGTNKELLHGIPIIFAVGYGLFGLTALVALLFPRIEMDMPDDWMFMKVTLLIVVIAMAFLLQKAPFWFAAAAVFLQLSHKNSV